MSEHYDCARCGRKNIRPFSSYADPRHLCETCAIAAYKEKYPLIWDQPLLRPEYWVINFDNITQEGGQ